MTSQASDTTMPVELLHPFYLDTDMSMAFAAALAGGVALQREDVEREQHESEAVRNLRGNVRFFGALGPMGGAGRADAGREQTEGEAAQSESRLVRQHTEASIFIALHDELQRTNRLRSGVASDLVTGELVSLNIGPAVAPLRRIVDQVIRVLDVAVPVVGVDAFGDEGPASSGPQKRRKGGQPPATKPAPIAEDESLKHLRVLRSLMVALKDDLDHSGMVDVVVRVEGGTNVIVTLDKRFMTEQALELLHTARFTVIGKVTQVWPEETDVVSLYRRSVLSLAPAFAGTVMWGMLTLLAELASSFDPAGAEKAAYAAARVKPAGVVDGDEPDPGDDPTDADGTEGVSTDGSVEGDSEGDPPQEEIIFGEGAIEALNPAVNGPAIQVLPLAICA
jgi:hypothetical protein